MELRSTVGLWVTVLWYGSQRCVTQLPDAFVFIRNWERSVCPRVSRAIFRQVATPRRFCLH
jgi:hypothetical protein